VRPDLFSALGIAFPSYFVLLLTGFFFATAVAVLWARRIGQDPDVMVDLGLAMLLSGVVGARLMHVFFDGHFMDYVHLCTDPKLVDWHVSRARCLSREYSGVWDAAASVCHPAHTDCFAWARFWAGGLTYFGGFVGASAIAYPLLKRDRFPFWKAADIAGAAVPTGLAFGRVGCLLAGCCFGAPTDLPWGLRFPDGSPADDALRKAAFPATPTNFHVHPTQVYESLASLAVAAVCVFVVLPRKRYDGQVMVAFLVLYSVARFIIEIWRRDDRGGYAWFSTSQIVGILLVGLAVWIHRVRRPAV
jgi:phosphatidylglycerol:prolipoprotein diacylglycerol transferase